MKLRRSDDCRRAAGTCVSAPATSRCSRQRSSPGRARVRRIRSCARSCLPPNSRPMSGVRTIPTRLQISMFSWLPSLGAYEQSGMAPPRRPWPDPLPGRLEVSELAPAPQPLRATLGLADEPSRQRQRPVVWGPGDGNLMLYGVVGSGTTTALATLAVGLARSSDPNDLHLYVLDFDDQLLAPLARPAPHGWRGGCIGS